MPEAASSPETPPRSSSSGSFNRTKERLDDFCEKGIQVCIFAILGFAPLAFGAARLREFSILAGIEVIALGLWLVRIWVRNQYRMLFPPFAWTVLAFTSYAIFRYHTAEIPYLAREELFRILTYALFFFLVLDNCQKQETMQWLVFIPIAVGVVISFYALFQYLTDHQWVINYPKPLMYKGRGSGPYTCPNHLAGYLEMLVPLTIAFVFSGRLNHITKILLGYAGLVMLMGIGLSFSRAGWLAAGIGLVLVLVALAGKRDYRIPAFVLLGLMAVGLLLLVFKGGTLTKRFTKPLQTDTRVLFWRPAIELWKEHFWTGVGPNHYDVRFRKYRHWQVQSRPVYTHSDYLNLLADYGTIGGVLVLLALGAAGWGLVRTWKFVHRQNDIGSQASNRSAMVLGVSAGLGAILFHSAFDFNMHIGANALLAVLLLTILTIHFRFATERFWFKPGLLGRMLATAVIIGGMIWLSMTGWVLGRESHRLLQAEAYVTGPGYLLALQRAYKINPVNAETAERIGNYVRELGFEGDDGYQQKLKVAISWFDRASALNRWDPYAPAGAAMCWHWLNQPEKAEVLMEKALALDPRNHFVMAMYAWHVLQSRDFEEARVWFKNSLAYSKGKHSMAEKYLAIVERRLAEQAQNQ